MTTSVAEEIEGLEAETWKAMSKDGRELLQYLSHDCQMVFPLGMSISHKSNPSIEAVMTSEAFVPWKKYTMSHVVVTEIGRDGAIISYRVSAIRPDVEGIENKFRALMSSVWRKNPTSGNYEMCFHQQSPYDQSVEDLA